MWALQVCNFLSYSLSNEEFINEDIQPYFPLPTYLMTSTEIDARNRSKEGNSDGNLEVRVSNVDWCGCENFFLV